MALTCGLLICATPMCPVRVKITADAGSLISPPPGFERNPPGRRTVSHYNCFVNDCRVIDRRIDGTNLVVLRECANASSMGVPVVKKTGDRPWHVRSILARGNYQPHWCECQSPLPERIRSRPRGVACAVFGGKRAPDDR